MAQRDGTMVQSGGQQAIAVVPVDPTTLDVLGGAQAAATSTAIGSTAASTSVKAAATGQRLMGYSLRENAGAAASVVLHNSTAANAPILYVTLLPGQSVSEWFGPTGKAAAAGIYLEVVSGTVIGQVDTVVAS